MPNGSEKLCMPNPRGLNSMPPAPTPPPQKDLKFLSLPLPWHAAGGGVQDHAEMPHMYHGLPLLLGGHFLCEKHFLCHEPWQSPKHETRFVHRKQPNESQQSPRRSLQHLQQPITALNNPIPRVTSIAPRASQRQRQSLTSGHSPQETFTTLYEQPSTTPIPLNNPQKDPDSP